MSNDFKAMYESLKAEQVELNDKMKAARAEAIEHIQGIIDTFGITAADLSFAEEPKAASAAGRRTYRTRGPSPVKYRTPTGIEWSGKGNMKKSFREYLASQGLTPEDKDLFLTDEFRK